VLTMMQFIKNNTDDDYVNRLECIGNYSATSNNIKLVHWPFIGGLFGTASGGWEPGRPVPSSLYQM